MQPLLAEAFRLFLMRGLEGQLWQNGFRRVAGVDEVGRGCLAGPVVAAAVVVDEQRVVPGVEDSKRLRPEERERLAAAIRSSARDCRVVALSAAEIDRTDILRATRSAMQQALACLQPAPDCALVDAVALPDTAFPVLPVVRGDALSYAVACASIVAKVERDRMMRDYDERYPHYGFAAHKGYAVAAHREALAIYGPSPIHRLSFRSVVPRVAAAGARRSG